MDPELQSVKSPRTFIQDVLDDEHATAGVIILSVAVEL